MAKRLVIVRSLLIAMLALAGSAVGGGPKYVAGVSYFDPGTAGTPLTWAAGQVTYYTDQGDLSPVLPGPNADSFVADAFSQWTSVATAAVTATRAGQLAEDVSGANVYVNPDGSITMPADIMPTATGTPLGIVYDADGSVTDALLGQGAGDASQCFYNTAFGGADNFGSNATFLHALVVLNGNCAQTSSQLTDVKYRLVRVLGQVLGLGWSQVNINVLTHNPAPTPDDYAGFPVMHQLDPPNCTPITLCYANPYQPKPDDQASLSRLYPVTPANISNFPGKQLFSAATVRIHGSVFFTTSTGQAAQAMQGVNVVARWMDPSSGLPSRSVAAASVSGFLFCGNAGNMVTGFNDPTGQPFDRYGSGDTTVEGFFDLAGLPIPNGAGSGQYQLTVETINSLWSTNVGPYSGMQVQPSGSVNPIIVNVTLGGDFAQDILMVNSAVQKQDPFPVTSYASPAAVPLGGDWAGSLSPYGDLDYFWFSGQGNRTLSIMVTALDESGDASYAKAQPVIGMWSLTDPPFSPAPANTSSAFNTFFAGMTMLNAQLLQPADFRIGISDFRGDGRPDYRYHARILYGDNVSPGRASVAGGTPLSITGLGFQANTRTTIGNNLVLPLMASANQILVAAPAMADGVHDLTLTDPPTLASSVMSGAITYGAGPQDNLVLLPFTNPSTPVGGQAPNPVQVRVVAPDGATPVTGASVFWSSSPAAALSTCAGAASCTALSDGNGGASTLVTVMATGVTTITAQLAPASYSSPKQVQGTLQGKESGLDIALSPQTASIAQGANASLTLTARVLSNGAPLGGSTVNFQVMKGSATLTNASVLTNSNGYASTGLQVSAISSTVQVSACVGPNNAPCLSFYGNAVPASGILLQPVANLSQIAAAGQSLQPVKVRAVDFSSPPNPVIGASVIFQSVVERVGTDSNGPSGGDTNITPEPTPVILWSSQLPVITDANGLALLAPSTDGFTGALAIVGSAAAGSSSIPFDVEVFPPMN